MSGENKNSTKSISVVIPNYNGKYLLEANLPSVYAALNQTSLVSEIIVIDDASQDGSLAFLEQHYPGVKVLKNEINKGFSPTINKGIFAAQYELVLALNTDVQLTPDYFNHQLKYFEKPDTFGVMGYITEPGNKHNVMDSGKYPKVLAEGIKTTYNYMLLNENDTLWLPSFFLSGANALMDRNKLMTFNGFDEVYAPYYYEDADLGIRAWRAGWKCYVEPKAICMHAISSTVAKEKSEKVKLIAERNRIVFNRIHLSGIDVTVYIIWLWTRCFLKLLKGDTIVYNAMQMYKNSEAKVLKSKEAIRKLQEQNKVNYTIGDIENIIKQQIKQYPYRLF